MEKIIRKIAPSIPSLPKQKRVAAYARVSSGKDAMLHSMSAQVSSYSSLIQRNPEWAYAGVYADEAITGTKDDRQGFQQMLDDCRAGKLDMILTKSISRFARNTVTLLETVRELKTLGVDVYFEEQNIHSMSGDGELMLSILASYAQEESRSVSENCKWRIRRDFAEGKPTYFRIYGYRMVNKQLQIIPEEAAVVRMIFHDYLDGLGRELLCKKLIKLGVKPMEAGEWHPNTISAMLKNECYAGDLRLQKSFVSDHIQKKKMKNKGELPQYLVQDCHEAIIDRQTFNAVQKLIAIRNAHFRPGNDAKERYPFSGCIRCQQCGNHYRRKIASAGTPYARPVWICTTFNRLGRSYCSSKQIPESILLQTSAEVLALDAFDEETFVLSVEQIIVTGPYELRYVFRNGKQVDVVWQPHSRRDSWTEEMKVQAAEHARRRYAK